MLLNLDGLFALSVFEDSARLAQPMIHDAAQHALAAACEKRVSVHQAESVGV